MIFLFIPFLSFADPIMELSSQLVPLRSQMESEAADLETLRQSSLQNLSALKDQISDLKQNLAAEKLKAKILNEKMSRLKKVLSSGSTNSLEDKKFVTQWINDLKIWVQSSVPYQTETRLKKLEEIQQRLELKEPLEPLVWDLWNFTSLELKNTKGFANEVLEINLNNNKVTAEVARLGMLHMYFKTTDQQLGFTKKTDAGWIWVTTENTDEILAIEKVLKASRARVFKNIFALPGLNPPRGQL